MNKKQIAITLGVMFMLLTAGIIIQVRTTQNSLLTVGQTLKENSLRDEILKWKEKYDTKYREFEIVQDRLDDERKKSTSNDESSIKKQEELKKINAYLGLENVKGNGLVITVKDNVAAKIGTAEDVVHDADLRELVNELKNAGAEAISINDQRITPNTAINCVGTVVQVNNERIGVPFVIKAIGNQEGLWGALTRPGGYVAALKSWGIGVDVKKTNDISIPKYNGVLNYKVMEAIK